jgi:hypothetical protein
MNRVFETVRRIWRSGIWGLFSLCAVNLSAAFTGISLGFSWLSGGTAMILGAPGVVGLLLLNVLFSVG